MQCCTECLMKLVLKVRCAAVILCIMHVNISGANRSLQSQEEGN